MNVVVEKRHFQRREKLCRKVLLGLIVLFFVATNAAIIFCVLNDDWNAYFVRWVILVTITALNIAFFLPTIVLFSWSAYKKHRSAFVEYRRRLVLQAVGTAIVLGIDLQNNLSEMQNQTNMTSPFQTSGYLSHQIAQRIGFFFFVLFKQP